MSCGEEGGANQTKVLQIFWFSCKNYTVNPDNKFHLNYREKGRLITENNVKFRHFLHFDNVYFTIQVCH